MRLALFNNYRLGVVEGDDLLDVTHLLEEHEAAWPFAWVPKMIMRWDQLRPRIEAALPRARRVPLAQARLRQPIPAPSKIMAAASNYPAHVAEMADYLAAGRFGTPTTAPQQYKSGLPDVPKRPPGERGEVFLKSPSSIIGPGETVLLPDTTPGREIHHEPELAAVIGRECHRIRRDQALDYVFGYMGLLDMTVRGDGDRSRRKSYPGFTPIGPWITTKDEVPDPQNLHMQFWVNDEMRQETNTGNMIESLAEIMEYASHTFTLMPGDIVTTGSPEGVAAVKDGDTLRIEIERLGGFTVGVEAT